MQTAGHLEVEKRDPFLQRLAAGLRKMHGRPTDDDLERAMRAALRRLMQAPAA
jgi:hypothetical protein